VRIVIEPERPADHAAIRAVVLAAFADQPSVAELVELIRASPEYLPELALVARVDGAVAGFVMVSHAELSGESGQRHRILTLSPLAVVPALQGRGIGSALVPAALAEAERLGEPLVVLEGSPRYYPRFGSRCRTGHRPRREWCFRCPPMTLGYAVGWSTRRRSPPSAPGTPESVPAASQMVKAVTL
jgi:putative acetyltransferase